MVQMFISIAVGKNVPRSPVAAITGLISGLKPGQVLKAYLPELILHLPTYSRSLLNEKIDNF